MIGKFVIMISTSESTLYLKTRHAIRRDNILSKRILLRGTKKRSVNESFIKPQAGLVSLFRNYISEKCIISVVTWRTKASSDSIENSMEPGDVHRDCRWCHAETGFL